MESMSNKVSIITVCYNCYKDLEKTIKSVLSQTYANKEYLIIDGGSTDGTKQVLQEYNSKIDFIVCEPDNGIYDAMNKGIKMATGDWIICMNAGDVFTSENILSNIFSHNIPSHKSFIYSNFWLFHEDGSRTFRHTDRKLGEIHHQNAIYRKSLHEQYGYYIVTHPYIVSDFLFFMAIPEDQYLKIDTPIANIQAGGISDNLWCCEQAWAVKVVYGIETIPQIFIRDIRFRFGLWRQRIKKRIKNILFTNQQNTK